MQSIIEGHARFHSGTWFKDEDKAAKTNPQSAHSLMIMEADTMRGAVLRKIKVPAKLISVAKLAHGEFIEVVVDVVETNYNNKPATEFRLLEIREAELDAVA